MKTVTFKPKDIDIKISVKEEFLAICSNPEDLTWQEIVVNFSPFKYLHNTEGPAMVFTDSDKKPKLYVIDGILIPPDTLLGAKVIKLIDDQNLNIETLIKGVFSRETN